MTHRGPFQPLLFCDSVILRPKELQLEMGSPARCPRAESTYHDHSVVDVRQGEESGQHVEEQRFAAGRQPRHHHAEHRRDGEQHPVERLAARAAHLTDDQLALREEKAVGARTGYRLWKLRAAHGHTRPRTKRLRLQLPSRRFPPRVSHSGYFFALEFLQDTPSKALWGRKVIRESGIQGMVKRKRSSLELTRSLASTICTISRKSCHEAARAAGPGARHRAARPHV